MDGFVMRLSDTGNVEWLSQISKQLGTNETITSVMLQNG